MKADQIQLMASRLYRYFNMIELGQTLCGNPELEEPQSLCVYHAMRQEMTVIYGPLYKMQIHDFIIKGGAIFGGQGNRTWFARKDAINRLSVKLSTDKVLMIHWLWAKKIGTKQCHEMLGDFIGMRNDHALTDWHHYIGELILDAMNQAPPLGGPNEIVEIDKSFFAGWRKPAANMHGQMLRGNQVGPARRNYGNGERGHWVFGMVHKRAKNLLDGRFFVVQHRNAATLIPFIQQHVAPGTTIRSDEWQAYNNLANLGYIHETVFSLVGKVIPSKPGQCFHSLFSKMERKRFSQDDFKDQYYGVLDGLKPMSKSGTKLRIPPPNAGHPPAQMLPATTPTAQENLDLITAVKNHPSGDRVNPWKGKWVCRFSQLKI
uniref:ISXO2-like transposase domain-containing protein n=1 Tax=Romanomermis culicivorax TaxID=13658 RepID=A0A915ILM5_ROMCU